MRAAEKAVAAERQAAVAYARGFCAELAALETKGRISATERQLLERRITAFAEGLEQGLHLEEQSDG